ncbi:hypothetical protein D3C75_989430 [compost metagenome]
MKWLIRGIAVTGSGRHGPPIITRLTLAVRRVMVVWQVIGEMGGSRPPNLRIATHFGATENSSMF